MADLPEMNLAETNMTNILICKHCETECTGEYCRHCKTKEGREEMCKNNLRVNPKHRCKECGIGEEKLSTLLFEN